MTRDEMKKLRELAESHMDDKDECSMRHAGTELLDLLSTLEAEEDNKCFRCKHGKRVVSAQCSYPYQDCDYVPK